MIPQTPYLIRAILDWVIDNGWTPHLLVDATKQGVDVPRQHVKELFLVDNNIILCYH